ncbi:hypothetical protein NE865_07496 [Phthorimaea operculella]|nr:hypothetical protein NE865_07496 [Phthorimaea operculella]
MEDAFNTLKSQKKNNLDGIIQWMKDAKILDGKTITEEKVKKTFGNAKGFIELEQFKEGMDKIAKDNKSTVDNYLMKLTNTGTVVENAFEKLKEDGKVKVDSAIQWMKDSKMISSAKESEEKARKMLESANDKGHVTLENFKDTVGKMADNTEKGLDKAINLVTETGPRLASAFTAATSAFQGAMKKEENK